MPMNNRGDHARAVFRRFAGLALTCLLLAVSGAGFADDADAEPGRLPEAEVVLPAYPKPEGFIEFYVSALATNRFFVDGATLSVSPEGVVYYALVIKTSGGATNVTYEGMRCETGEYRVFATGRSDGSWSKSRVRDWRPIENKPVNRHHATLSRDFFCAARSPINTPEEGVDALKRGKHPRAP